MRQQIFAVVACLSLVGCAATVDGTDEGSSARNAAASSDNSCRWKCSKCPPNRYCTQTCEQIGNCGSRCNSIAMCVEGYVWDDKSCQCVAQPTAGGEACGSKVCPSGQVCCNASCGICTDPGSACIQMMCDSTTVVE